MMSPLDPGRLIRLWRASPRRRLWAAGPLFAVVAIAAAFSVPAFPACVSDCPRLDDLGRYEPPAAPILYDGQGEPFAWLSGVDRIYVVLDGVPRALADGFVAVEDRRFYEHSGMDARSVFRALRVNVSSGDIQQGASTITMQLARNLWPTLTTDYGPWQRKLTEVRLARAIESKLSKEQILELYLNQIYLGDGVYGVGAASLHYFGVPVQDLGLDEIATLVGMARGPERYDPRSAPELTIARRNVVLDVFRREGIAPAALIEQASGRPLPNVESRLTRRGRSFYSAAVDRELRDLVPEHESRQGVHVFTALDQELQRLAEQALTEQIAVIEAGRLGRYEHDVPSDSLTRADGASPYLQGMVVVVDPSNGGIRAVVGGRDFTHSQYDRALQARRQPGSAFKPIVYAAALAEGMTPTDRFDTTAVRIDVPDTDEPWTPRESASLDGLMTVRAGLVRSSNRAAVWMGQRAGLGSAIRTAQALGVEGHLPRVPSLFLGSGEVVPAELVAAYAALLSGGRSIRPHLIHRIEDRHGHVVYETPEMPESGIDPGIAFLVRTTLEDVVASGTAWRIREHGYRGPAAGKTGTTNGGHDVWFVGGTPTLVAGVWLGFDVPKPIAPNASGGRLAAPVWGRIMGRYYEARDPGSWADAAARQRLIRAEVDLMTGHLATEHCPGEHVEQTYYVPGTEPTTFCPIHGSGSWTVTAQRWLARARSGG